VVINAGSSIVGNFAIFKSYYSLGGQGGGIYNLGSYSVNEPGGLSYAGTVILNIGGSISGNIASDGGGIYSTSMVDMKGGSITGNTAKNNGGGVFNSIDGTMNLTKESISQNHAGSQGGGIYSSHTVNLNGGSIDHNTAATETPSGGGIYNARTVNGDANIVHDNIPDQIVST
jgi:predicted outer membrane repeat protein